MENGVANKKFKPKGKEDAFGMKKGFWKDYMVEYAIVYDINNKFPKPYGGFYLLYLEGKFVNDRREGEWDVYAIEDKTFKKIHVKTVNYRHGDLIGDVTYYYPTGELAAAASYENEMLNGVLKKFYPNGSHYSEMMIEDDNREGPYSEYFETGKIKEEGHYVNDSLDGEIVLYYPNGNIKHSSFFIVGVIDGTYKYYYENGQLWIEKVYVEGKLMTVVNSYAENGELRDAGTLKDGNGTLKLYDWDGNLYNIITYEDGIKVAENKIKDEPKNWY